jgi:peptidoglycan hydrolase CwlO-like protein
MKRQIDDLRKRIAVVRDVVRQQEGRMRELEARIAHTEAKIREADALLTEPEREYNATCGRFGRPTTEWR